MYNRTYQVGRVLTLQVEDRVEGIVLLASTCNVIRVMF